MWLRALYRFVTVTILLESHGVFLCIITALNQLGRLQDHSRNQVQRHRRNRSALTSAASPEQTLNSAVTELLSKFRLLMITRNFLHKTLGTIPPAYNWYVLTFPKSEMLLNYIVNLTLFFCYHAPLRPPIYIHPRAVRYHLQSRISHAWLDTHFLLALLQRDIASAGVSCCLVQYRSWGRLSRCHLEPPIPVNFHTQSAVR